MNSLSFNERINLYIMEDFVSKIGKYPNPFLLKLLKKHIRNMRLEIINSPEISRKLKRFYLKVLKEPDLLEKLLPDSDTKSEEDPSDEPEETTEVVIESKVGGEDLLEKVDLNMYGIYRNNPVLIDNFNLLKEKIMWM